MALDSDNPASLTPAELQQRLHKLEGAYQECQRLALANDFAAAIMHEVNNPLEAITNLVYLSQHGATPDELHRYLAQIQEQLHVLASIARSSLAFHKGQNEAREINLMEIAESALKLHATRLRHRGIVVATEYCERPALQGVGSEILQIVSNLLLNAADALNETAEPQLKLSLRRTRSTLRLTIADNGPGIPEHMEKRIFQAHATGKKTGTGMGLWLSRRLAEKHGGTIRFRTCRRRGRSGTVFSMALPI